MRTPSPEGVSGTRPENVCAIERATGRSWPDWLALFTEADAVALPHPEIARIARAAMPQNLRNPDWWAQGTAIAFEQQVGIRVPGQSATGDFRVSASRTLTLDRDAAIAAWTRAHGDRADHLGCIPSQMRDSRTPKRSFVRFELADAGRVEVSATPKGADKAVLSVEHTKLHSAKLIDAWRQHWKSLLTEVES